MKGWELGHIFNFLVENRLLRSAAQAGQRLKPKEAEYAKFWELSVSEGERIFFDDFLQAQGFRLKRYDSFDMPGIPKEQFVYLLLRHGAGTLSSWASAEESVERVRCKYEKKLEPKDNARAWLALLWFSMLHLLYPRIGRGMSEVSRYQEAMFKKDELAETVREAVENQRAIQDSEPSIIRQILLGNDNPKIPNRVTNFISYLIEIGHLLEVEPGVCQQTLLASAEIGVSVEDGVNLLLPDDEVLEDEGTKLLNIQEPFQQVENAFELANNLELGNEVEF